MVFPRWQYSAVAFAPVAVPCGVHAMAVLLYGIRPSSSTPFISVPGGNIMAFILRRSFGDSILFIVYAPYDVFLVIAFPLLPPPVIIRLWLSPYDDLSVIVFTLIIYALITVFCGVSPVII